MQWKLPKNISSFVQRVGRASRASDRTGIGILLIEPTGFKRGTAKKGRDKPGITKKAEPRKDEAEGLMEQTEDVDFRRLIDMGPEAVCRRRVIAELYDCELNGK